MRIIVSLGVATAGLLAMVDSRRRLRENRANHRRQNQSLRELLHDAHNSLNSLRLNLYLLKRAATGAVVRDGTDFATTVAQCEEEISALGERLGEMAKRVSLDTDEPSRVMSAMRGRAHGKETARVHNDGWLDREAVVYARLRRGERDNNAESPGRGDLPHALG
jgi:chromosome segregation ATPase